MKPRALFNILSAARTAYPDQVAVVSGDVALTYSEVHSRALRMATLLQNVGVEPNDRVAIYVHKSVDSMAAVYGVLATGAAYVPLDPGASRAYIARIIDDADVRAVLTDARDIEVVDQLVPGCSAVAVSSADEMQIAEATIHASEPDDLAYIMFTSGSTGDPKGIMHTHASGLAYALRAAQTYGLTHQDRLANIAPLHFDQSTFELFAGPSAGATSYFIPEPYLKLPASLSTLIQDSRITVWYSVPFVLNQLLERGVLDERDLTSVRWVLFGGEVMGAGSLQRLMAHFSAATFSNVYGPAEVNQCTVYNLESAPESDRPIPIGQPWDRTEAQISAEGELLVRTDTMMVGYWKRPDLTQAAIVDGWYRTGDLVTPDSEGNLVFGGRIDNQVKVRGQRVELEAVDLVLDDHPAVAHAITVLADGPGGLPVLVAMVVPVTDTEIDAKEILLHAAARLPPAAVPFRIDAVQALPRTGSGKIDRRASAELMSGAATV